MQIIFALACSMWNSKSSRMLIGTIHPRTKRQYFSYSRSSGWESFNIPYSQYFFLFRETFTPKKPFSIAMCCKFDFQNVFVALIKLFFATVCFVRVVHASWNEKKCNKFLQTSRIEIDKRVNGKMLFETKGWNINSFV